MLHYLKIAMSAVCLTACLLLVALWVRSYHTYDDLIGHVSDSRLVAFSSWTGRLGVSTSVWPSLPPLYTDYEPWKVNSFKAEDEGETWFAGDDAGRHWEFYLARPPNQESAIVFPHWFAVFMTAGLAAAPWIRKLRLRFSLRALLIATTLAALVLGIVAMSN